VGLVFGRNAPKTHTEQMRNEILESYGHLKMAAAHAAGASAERLTPPYDKARDACAKGLVSTRDAFAPLYETMREGARNARAKAEKSVTEKQRTWPVLIGFLAAGAAIGAAGAMIARRRRLASQWQEYEPRDLEDTAAEAAGGAASKVSVATKKVTAGAAAVADSVSTQASKLADTLHQKSGTVGKTAESATEAAGEAASSFAAFADETAENLVARAGSEHRQ
jgi:hypothetical protein